MLKPLHPIALQHLHCANAETTHQTIAESKITHSIDLGRGFTVHHGSRYGAPIVLLECEGQTAQELTCIWYDESIGAGA